MGISKGISNGISAGSPSGRAAGISVGISHGISAGSPQGSPGDLRWDLRPWDVAERIVIDDWLTRSACGRKELQQPDRAEPIENLVSLTALGVLQPKPSEPIVNHDSLPEKRLLQQKWREPIVSYVSLSEKRTQQPKPSEPIANSDSLPEETDRLATMLSAATHELAGASASSRHGDSSRSRITRLARHGAGAAGLPAAVVLPSVSKTVKKAGMESKPLQMSALTAPEQKSPIEPVASDHPNLRHRCRIGSQTARTERSDPAR